MKLEEIEREDYQQEMLKEEAEKYSREMWGPYYDEVYPDEPAITLTLGELSVKDFSGGAKWQARRMYSEDIINILDNVRYWETCPDEYKNSIESFLQQFKKK